MATAVCDNREALLMDWNGERLKELRTLRGWTQDELAELAGIENSSNISRWENGKARPGVAELFKLADALRVSCEAFRQPVGMKPLKARRAGDADDD